MFGGQGIYGGELMFALEVGGELYLKADAESVGFFQENGSRPFTYETREGRKAVMSYWLMPESALDDPDEAAELAAMALAAARRAAAAKAKKSSKTRKRSAQTATSPS
jgi:DNA transformation protein